MLQFIDNILNNFTMYRVVLYSLCALVVYSLVLSVFGVLPFSSIQLLISTTVIAGACYASNFLFAKLLHAPVNAESWLITALILVLIMDPATTLTQVALLAGVGAIAMGSKYLFAVKTKHIFNPAAVGAFAYMFVTGATWWVGNPYLFPVVTILGLLIVRKLRRFSLFFSFLISSSSLILFTGWMYHAAMGEFAMQLMNSWPIIFFGTIMLTEPLTTPPTRKLQMIYGTLVGLLFGFPFHSKYVSVTPELALMIGNLFSFAISPKQKLVLKLKEKNDIGGDMHEFVFTPTQKLQFVPGQYVEWTLPHLSSDTRGNRRYFTIASSPTENELRLGVKIPENSSSFKRALLEMKSGDQVYVGQLAGDFTLPADPTKKLVFIAGGIGVTPFRSMLKCLSDVKQKRDIIFFYAVSAPNEIMYKDVFADAAKTIGTNVRYVITRPESVPRGWNGLVGRLTPEMIQKEVAGYQNRTYYLSGPHAMVTAYEGVLASVGVPSSQIIVDYFPGF